MLKGADEVITKSEERRQKQNLMVLLGCSEEEAIEVMAADKAIDRGEKMDFDLPPDKAKVAKEYTRTGTRKVKSETENKGVTVYDLDNTGGKRNRKENPTKGGIIAELAKFLMEQSENACENVEITNKERQIAFSVGENSYELTLVQKRKPKS
jgi:hypothetical protein